MKIAFDVDVLAKQMDINRMVHQVADWCVFIFMCVFICFRKKSGEH